MGSYVALTRVEKRSDLVIYRPFPREVFAKGRPMSLELLLKTWRQEQINWAKIEEEHMPSGRCQHCGMSKYKPYYMQAECTTQNRTSVCKECVKDLSHDGTALQCSRCETCKLDEGFFAHSTHMAFHEYSRLL